MRKCSGPCGETRQLVAFATFRSRKGELRRRGICKECRDLRAVANTEALREYRRKYNADNAGKRHSEQAVRRAAAKQYVDEYKLSRPCTDCGRRFPAVAVDLDHVRGAKVKSVSSLVSGAYKLDLIKIEIAKCDVVCACCHRIRTAMRKENLSPHVPARQKDRLPTYPPQRSLSKTRYITFNGETHSVAEWGRRLGIPGQTIGHRLRKGYSVEQALSTVSYTTGSSPVYKARHCGEALYNAKLSVRIVKRIRADRVRGMTQQRIADKYNVSQSTVSAVLCGRTWRHVV